MPTNEVANASVGVKAVVANSLSSQLSAGQDLYQQIVTWISEKGVDFAINVISAALIFLVGWLVIRLIGAAVLRALTRNGKKKTLFTSFVSSVVMKICWAILLVMVLGRLGVDVAPLIAGFGVTGFILGFAFQESLGNLASGMMIAINEPFKVGDVVDAAGHTGAIVEVNMMATVMATADNKRIVLPNKSVWGGPIVNYSALDKRRVDLQVGIAYGENVERAISVIRETVAKVPGVLAEPAPAVAVAGLDESQVTMNVRPWSKTGDYWAVYSGVLQAVKEELDRAGIEIPFPQVMVHTAAK
ncbi:MAG: mechanosensitive ion channel family protein [Kiritimatiellia bacterium]|nr:mechanosensitive ion channel family protein [Kiritimatiellia bacterium]